MDIFNKKQKEHLKKELEKSRNSISELQQTVLQQEALIVRVNAQNHELLETKKRLGNRLEKLNKEIATISDNIEERELKLAIEKEELYSKTENNIIEIRDQHKRELRVEKMLLTNSLQKQISILKNKHQEEISKARLTKCKELPLKIKSDIQKLISEKETGFPWLSHAIAHYYENIDKIYAEYLENKPRPALKQAAKIKEIAKEKAQFKKEFLLMRYINKYYESLFPWLSEYIGANSDEILKQSADAAKTDENLDPVLNYMAKGEYESLSKSERNQKALDRYWNSRKTLWQIGRDYERYIGYLYEKEGYKVQYFGIQKGMEDLGRDLVCFKGNIIEVVQCKYWSKVKNIPIRENHINQLFGTTVKYYIDYQSTKNNIDLHSFFNAYETEKIIGTMVTSAHLSETALNFAKSLKIKVKQDVRFDKSYPSIKCNVNPNTKEKIYHLPFDQQYDKVIINKSSGEFYAHTVAEAEENGFRRAWKWKGKN